MAKKKKEKKLIKYSDRLLAELKAKGVTKRWVYSTIGVSKPNLDRRLRDNDFTKEQKELLKSIVQ